MYDDFKMMFNKGNSIPLVSPATLFMAGEAGEYWNLDAVNVWADTAATIPITNGTAIARINGLSINAHHLLMNTVAARPIWRANAGKPYAELDGIDDGMLVAGMVIPQPYDRISSFSQETWTSGEYIYDGGTFDQSVLFQNGASPSISMFAGAVGPSGSASLGTPHVVSERFNGASSSLRIDNTETTGNPGTAGATGFTLGMRADTLNANTPLKWFGGVLRPGTMTAQQLSDMRAYYANKAGI